MSLFIGLMSGTSMDGVDAALVDVHSNTLLAGVTHPYSPALQQHLTRLVQEQTCRLSEFEQLNTRVGLAFAEAAQRLLQQSGVERRQVTAIGSHGQTVAHDATADIPYTIQLGCPHTIVENTQLPVVADFRTRDLVLGGLGAPLAPIYHDVLFQSYDHPLAVINIGGITNVTMLLADGSSKGFDIGPGNCLMDQWIMKHLGHSYDDKGAWASSGSVCTPLLEGMLGDPYFEREAPKSIGREYFSMQWLQEKLDETASQQLPENDIQATLLALTATSIAQCMQSNIVSCRHLFLCGGGAHNQALKTSIKTQLPGMIVESTDSAGINPDMLEAMMMAWLAEKAWTNQALDLTRITGAKRPCVQGVIYT